MARIKVYGRSAVYHCMSRVVAGQALLDDLGKEQLVKILFSLATFCGIEVITYCMMSNHFHILVRVPEQQNPSGPGTGRATGSPVRPKKGAWVQLARQWTGKSWRRGPRHPEGMLERMGRRIGVHEGTQTAV